MTLYFLTKSKCRVQPALVVGRRPLLLLLCRSKTTVTKRTTTTTTTSSRIVIHNFDSIPSQVWKFYTRHLNERPLLTKAFLASFIFCSSDAVTQYLSRNKQQQQQLFEWDIARSLSGASFGIIATTWLHYWWGALEVIVNSKKRSSSKLVQTAVKVTLDQAIGAPLYIYSYYVLTNFLTRVAASAKQQQQQQQQNDNYYNIWMQTNHKAATMLWPTMLQHWRLWVPVHSINFYFVPLHHRVLVQNSVLVFWSAYLSHLNNNNNHGCHGRHETELQTPDHEMEQQRKQQELLKQQ